MGYATLDTALALPDYLPPEQSHIVITDTLKSDANFLIHHFIGNHLKSGRYATLVGLAQIFNHYFLIGRKLGMNLQALKQSGQFCFLDGVTHLNPYTKNSPYPPPQAPSAPSGLLDGSDITDEILRSFYFTIKSHVVKPHSLLVLDDASVLLFSGFGIRTISAFIKKLNAYMESIQGTLITVVHADEEGSEDVEQDMFVKSMVGSADLVLQVEALGSGLARDVHGQTDFVYQLSVVYGPKYAPGSTNTVPQSLHYKVLDNNVHFFAKGISQN
ncbi:Elongator subunit elp6 [Apophysomyces sp. BC1034]|nr:Elongator subunit elp6 [Apophysomyces sp. BC1015]KAG0171083.1 Elongator subunit elp6 [Apophysomyces sp. BC1021]KAG0184770.1 Elongator subunit elp6 [Apophysomyces sp. BC1034]